MDTFYGKKKLEILPSILAIIGINIVEILVICLMNSYLMLNLAKLLLVISNGYYLYYIGVWFTVKYVITQDEIKILALGGIKKVIIPIDNVISYTTEEGKIKGIGLSGLFSNRFAIGRIAVKSLGTTRMFVTNSTRIIYIETKDLNYGISPLNPAAFEKALDELNIPSEIWQKQYDKPHKLYKEKKFLIPIAISTVCILCITFLPMILYIFDMLPDVLPIALTAKMTVIEVGTDKQFAFSQMTYGVLNMAVFFCMYYAAQFCAKYDRKSAYNYIYLAMFIAMVFLYLQIRLITFKL